ncbi:hypothetical protein [Nocardioides sp. WS12]|uniref:hypothetical protein n=1 Tax=Nocardioides sp. WS12 TaxID=2486272 RepID=UPI0015FB2945|nr:hypothetical protein [Nocardioides sp. WS12]
MAILEDFEGGTVDDLYDETAGDGWTVQALNRTSGFAQPTYRPLPDPTWSIPAPPGVAGDQGLAFTGSSAWALSVDYAICAGLGGFFYSDQAGAGGSSSSSLIVSIGFVNEQAAGSITVDRRGDELRINEFYDDLVTYVDNDSTVVLGGTFPRPVWLEINLLRTGGWTIRDVDADVVLAHGDYPYLIPASAPWDLNMQPNQSGPGGPSGSIRVMADDIYGFDGSSVAPAVRLFPRDDGRGMSSAPRIWPPPKANRVIGGYP